MTHTLRLSPIAADNDRSRSVDWQHTFDAALSTCSPHLSIEEVIGRAACIANSLHGTFKETERFGVSKWDVTAQPREMPPA